MKSKWSAASAVRVTATALLMFGPNGIAWAEQVTLQVPGTFFPVTVTVNGSVGETVMSTKAGLSVLHEGGPARLPG